MTRTKSIIGALALCALSICAFGAASASALPELTAVECLNKGAGSKYSTAQCATPAVAGNFETVAIELNKTKEVTGASTGQEPVLRAVLGGSNVTVKCASSELIGASVTNKEPSAGKHTIETTATRNTYSNCHVFLKADETRFCVVVGVTAPGGEGMISTTELKGTTTGVEHLVKIEPKAGAANLFTEFTLKKKGTNLATENNCFLNNDVTVQVKGFVEAEADTNNHAHLTFTEANNGTELKANGVTAKYLDTVGGVVKGTTTVVGAETFT